MNELKPKRISDVDERETKYRMATWMSTKYKYCANIAKKKLRQSNRMAEFLVFLLSSSLHSLNLFDKPMDKHEMQQISSHQKLQCTPCTLLFTHSMVLPWTFLSFSIFFLLYFFFFLTCDVLSSRWHESKTKTHKPFYFFFFVTLDKLAWQWNTNKNLQQIERLSFFAI